MLSVDAQRSECLMSAVEELAGAATVDDIVEALRTSARRLIGADGIAVILREGEECRYVEEDAVGPLWKGQCFPLTSCVSGWAMLNRETVVIPDITKDDRVPYELYRDTFVRSMAMVPVRSADPIGAIGAYWSDLYVAPPEIVNVLERLARATATAVENVRLVGALSRALAHAELARDELRHRVKNAYAATQALAVLSLPREHARALNGRISALARAHELLDHKLARQDTIELRDLVTAELQPYAVEQQQDRVQISGERITLASAEAIALGLALNELATNSLKYGALSVPAGQLMVSWFIDHDHVVVAWRETDGPEVRASALENFGSRLRRRLVEGQLKGTIERDMAGDGVTCRIVFRPALGPVLTEPTD